MADVYLAVDMQASRVEVAVKLFKEDVESDSIVNEIFSRESRALYAFDHPNIVKVFDFGRDERTKRRFLVLEWLPNDLVAQIAKRPFSAWETYFKQVGHQVLEGLCYAYEKGYAHRDLKPHNILLDAAGIPKIVDFGISRLREAISPAGKTVRDFVSRPYTPPENEDFVARDTRDVFSYAALSVHALAGGKLSTYEDLDRAFQQVTLPARIRSVFGRALSRQPAERQANVLTLLDELAAAGAIPSQRSSLSAVIHLAIPRNVGERIQKQLVLGNTMLVEQLIGNELSADVGLRLRDPSENDGQARIIIFGQEHVLTAVVHQATNDHLVLLNVVRRRAFEIGRDRESALSLDIKFAIGRPTVAQGSQATINSLLAKLSDHEEAIKARDQYRAEDAVFRTWLSVLRAKDDIESSKEQPIRFSGTEIRENRIELSTEKIVDDSLVGQRRLIRLPQARAIRGEIESANGKRIVLWTERRWTVDDVPQRGDLLLDTTIGRIPVQRQLDALAATRFARTKRPDFRNFIIDPAKALAPESIENVSFYQDDLDEDKKEAVKAALGNRDVLVIHGPPGTGKTKIITEVIAQICRRKPKARILLTSQTNVALDNALERLLAIAPDLQTVRIGRRDDLRIADSIRELLLDNKSAAWIKDIRKRNDDFLTSWARDNKVKREDIQLGIAAGRLRAIKQLEADLNSQHAGIKKDLEEATAKLKTLEEQRTSDTYFDVSAKIDSLSAIFERLDGQLEALIKDRREAIEVLRRLGPIGQDLVKMTAAELAQWEKGLLDQGESGQKFRQLIDLSEEWLLRLARPEEFHAAFLVTAQVVAGTCIGVAGVKGVNQLDFDVCILDEASKALATESLVPMSLALSWILVGDEKQLPPFVDAALDDRAILREYSLDRRDLEDTGFARFSTLLPPANIKHLTSQYRMAKPIGDLISECFYGGSLQSKRDPAFQKLALAFPRPVTWYSTSQHQKREETPIGPSFLNSIEAKIATDVVRRINFVAQQMRRKLSIAVISGYRAQVQELVRRISNLGALEFVAVECNSVDAFQGREADICLYSVTRANPRGDLGFLSERRRLNVALSRARDGLVIIGDHRFCETALGENPFAAVIRYVGNHLNSCKIDLVSE